MPIEQFFCHRCNTTFDLETTGHISCTRCNGEFVEMVNHFPEDENPAPRRRVPRLDDLFRDYVAPVVNAAQGVLGGAGGAAPAPGAPAPDTEQAREAAALEDWIANMFRYDLHTTGETGRPGMTFSFQVPGGFQYQTHPARTPPSRVYLGETEAERVDLEQAMNEILATFQQIDGTGHHQRGFTADEVTKYLPMKKVSAAQVENGAQCTTCFDTFKLGEDVGALDCNHIFHRPCIEPWLATKNSCPVCRQKVSMKAWKKGYQKKTQEAVLEDLD